MRRRHDCIKVAARRSGRPISTRPYQITGRDWTVLSQWDQRLVGLDPSDPDSKSLFDRAVSAALSLVEECQWDIQPCAELLLSISNSEYRRLAIQKFVRQGVGKLWTDQSEALAVILRYYKEQRPCEAVKGLADELATEEPTFDVYERLITNPDLPLFRDCLEVLHPHHSSDSFHFPTHLRSLISHLRTCIRNSELSMSIYCYIKHYTVEKRRAFEDLLNCEYPNEEPELLRNALDKTLASIGELMNRIQRIDLALKELWAAIPKTCTISQELLSLVDSEAPSSHRNADLASLHRFLSLSEVPYAQAEQLVFPIRITEYAEILDAQDYKHRDDSYRCFRNELLRIAFPEILLHSTVTEGMKVIWQDLHSRNFTSFVGNMCLMKERLFAVFTRDEADVPKGNYVIEKATYFPSIDDFKMRFSHFLGFQPEQVYILDISSSEAHGISVESAKAAAEEFISGLVDSAKSFCLLVRIPRKAEQVTGLWGRHWQLLSCEQLHQVFQEDIQALKHFLQQDTKELLAAPELWDKEGTRSNIVKRIYDSLEVSEEIKTKRVQQILKNPQLMEALTKKLQSVLPTSRVSDWKLAVLSSPALLSEPTLQSARCRALEIEAAALLAPILRAAEYYNAFPSFFREGSSNIKNLWVKSFALLQGMDRVGEMLDCECLFPFSAKDYEEVVLKMATDEQTQVLMKMYQGFETDELLQLYIGDLARIDLRKSEMREYGEFFYKGLCATAHKFADAIATFRERRPDIMLLCSCSDREVIKEARNEALLGLEALLPDPAAPRNSHLLLVQRLEDFKEFLEVNGGLPYRLYSISGNILTVVRCRNEKLVRITLKGSLKLTKASILPLSSTELFCCGGKIKGLIFTEPSHGTWLVTVNTGDVFQYANMKAARFDHGLVKFDDWVYAIGGCGKI